MVAQTGTCRQRVAQVRRGAQERFLPFLVNHANPGTYERDRDNTPLPPKLVKQAVASGLGRFVVPVELGGEGASVQDWGLLLEWLGYESNDLALPVLLGYRQAAADLVYQASQGTLRGAPASAVSFLERYVTPSVNGELTLSLAYTEGADPFAFRSRARKAANGYVLSGEKSWVTAGAIADAVLTVVGAEDGELRAFVIERTDPGVTFSPRDLMGMRGLGVARMQLEDVFIPDERVLISNDALTIAQRFFNERRLFLPCSALGRVQRMFDDAVTDLSERIRYRLPVTEMQAVQARLGRVFVALHSARTLVYDTLDRVAEEAYDPVWDVSVSASKYFATQQCELAMRELVHVLGGVAYERTEPYERALRDIQALIHLAGTQATLEVDLGIKAIAVVEQRSSRRRGSPERGGVFPFSTPTS